MAYNPNAVWTSKQRMPGASGSGTGPGSEPEPKTQSEMPKEIQPETKHPKAPEPSEEGPSFFHRHALMLFSLGLVVLLAAGGGLVFFLRPPSAPNVSIGFTVPKSFTVGAPTVITISPSNDSNTSLTGAVLTVTLPNGISFVGDDPTESAKEYPLGTINPGAVAAQTSTIVVTGNPESLQRIGAKLTYNTPETASTTFVASGTANALIGDSAISLSYTAPQNIVSGQSFTFTVNYGNSTSQDVSGVSIQAAFPPAFTFSTSSLPTADLANDTWNIGAIPAGTSGSFTVTGTIIGQPQAQYQMGGTVLVAISGQSYPINLQTLSFAVSQPPLALTITPNNSTTYISSAGDSLQYVLAYANNSNVTFTGVKISAALLGQMFDYASLQTSGAFSSKTDAITWTAATTPALSSVAPGQSGTVTFSVKTKSAFPIKLPSDKNYTLQVTGTIQSPTVAPDTAGSSTIAVTELQTKIGGAIALAANGAWKSGPYPPRVNQATQYAVTWNVVNYATDAKNVTVSAYLQSGTTLAGAITSNISSTPTYDPGTGLISWTIPGIAAGTGVITPPIQAIIPISNVPAVNQVGQSVTILGKSSLSATDSFTGEALSANADAVTTALPNDKGVSHQSGGTVAQ